jgi:protoporphyrinogen oxidase
LSRNTIKNIGYFSTLLIGFSYLKAVLFPIKKEKSLEDFFINRFGKRLYQTFFKDYTEKVWGVSCHEISAEWGAQRIKGLSITTTILHFLKQIVKSNTIDINQKNIETSLIEYFLYPKFGPGQMWNEVASKIEHQGGDLTQNEKVVKINILDNTVQSVVVKNLMTNKEEEVFADYFISSMPVTELLASFSCAIPENVKEVASGLCYRDFITVGLLLKKMNHTVDDNWIYIQEPSVKVGRLQIFNNWSPYLVKDENTIWVGLEYFCNENDDLWNKSENELKELAVSEMIALGFINQSDMLDATVIKMPKTYPAYFGTYNRFDEIIKFTDTISNLFLIGRNGMHKYNNQDHSMLTAMQVVQNIKANDFDKSTIWKINTEQEFHEEK